MGLSRWAGWRRLGLLASLGTRIEPTRGRIASAGVAAVLTVAVGPVGRPRQRALPGRGRRTRPRQNHAAAAGSDPKPYPILAGTRSRAHPIKRPTSPPRKNGGRAATVLRPARSGHSPPRSLRKFFRRSPTPPRTIRPSRRRGLPSSSTPRWPSAPPSPTAAPKCTVPPTPLRSKPNGASAAPTCPHPWPRAMETRPKASVPARQNKSPPSPPSKRSHRPTLLHKPGPPPHQTRPPSPQPPNKTPTSPECRKKKNNARIHRKGNSPTKRPPQKPPIHFLFCFEHF
jgi:hypothetical protein